MNKPMEWYRMKVSEMQRRLANKAMREPEHRFINLFDFLTWEPLMEWAFDKLMTNRGSRTAGIDGLEKRTAIRNKEQILHDLRAALKSGTYQHQPVRRVYIPKGNGKQRPLGIPTLVDRLVQMMVKAILEPIFESDFLPCSHGFRPGLSCHTAMAHLHLRMAPRQKKMFWVIEGDITGCFDHIQHKILVRLIKRRIRDRKLIGIIWQMLKAGILEGKLFKKTREGTPQGGIASPLLANIYLHELDQWFDNDYVGLNYNEKNRCRQRKEGNAFYLRYADDFVVAWNGSKEKAGQLKADLSTFLIDRLHLGLSQEKTHITHVTDGFDFLGFTVKRTIDPKRGHNALVFSPSKKSVLKVKRKIKEMTCRGKPQASVRDKIEALNYLLRGWSNYYRHSCASQTFGYVGSNAFKRTELWLRKKTRLRVRDIYRTYYRRCKGSLTWVDDDKALYHPGTQTRIRYKKYRHRPNPYLDVQDEADLPYHLSPYPGKREWQGYHSYGEKWTAVRQEILERDGFCCRLCGRKERVEVHHRRKHRANKEHTLENLITLCSTCHRQVRNPRSNIHHQLSQIST